MSVIKIKHSVELTGSGNGMASLEFEIEGQVARFVTGCDGCGCDIKTEFALNQGSGIHLTDFFTACLDLLKAEGL